MPGYGGGIGNKPVLLIVCRVCFVCQILLWDFIQHQTAPIAHPHLLLHSLHIQLPTQPACTVLDAQLSPEHMPLNMNHVKQLSYLSQCSLSELCFAREGRRGCIMLSPEIVQALTSNSSATMLSLLFICAGTTTNSLSQPSFLAASAQASRRTCKQSIHFPEIAQDISVSVRSMCACACNQCLASSDSMPWGQYQSRPLIIENFWAAFWESFVDKLAYCKIQNRIACRAL